MRRSSIALALILILSAVAAHAADNPPMRATSGDMLFPAFSFSGSSGSSSGKVSVQSGSGELYQRIISSINTPLLRWPNKKISLDVKDTSIRRIADMLGAQTGIAFTVKEAVPSSLKITIQVGDMDVKQFLDTLCAATNLTYMAESRAKAKETKLPPDQEQLAGVQVTAPEIKFNPTGQGYEMLTPTGANIVVLNGAGNPVTDVTISSLAAEGVVVNMGTVSMSVKDADPVEVATKLIKQINGASYMIMDLNDYLALQDSDRAAEIEKSLQKAPRSKVTLSMRNVPIQSALTKLAEKGHFYITSPQPGQSSFLIIPDVIVVDPKVMPGLALSPFAMGDASGILSQWLPSVKSSK